MPRQTHLVEEAPPNFDTSYEPGGVGVVTQWRGGSTTGAAGVHERYTPSRKHCIGMSHGGGWGGGCWQPLPSRDQTTGAGQGKAAGTPQLGAGVRPLTGSLQSPPSGSEGRDAEASGRALDLAGGHGTGAEAQRVQLLGRVVADRRHPQALSLGPLGLVGGVPRVCLGQGERRGRGLRRGQIEGAEARGRSRAGEGRRRGGGREQNSGREEQEQGGSPGWRHGRRQCRSRCLPLHHPLATFKSSLNYPLLPET